mgnify:CR=1 FL=1
MQIIADLHTHTLSATHAFNTLDEMAAKAAALHDHPAREAVGAADEQAARADLGQAIAAARMTMAFVISTSWYSRLVGNFSK